MSFCHSRNGVEVCAEVILLLEIIFGFYAFTCFAFSFSFIFVSFFSVLVPSGKSTVCFTIIHKQKGDGTCNMSVCELCIALS